PKSRDLVPKAAASKPSATRPRLSSSRTVDARDGMPSGNRELSRTLGSSFVSMTWRRSSRESAIAVSRLGHRLITPDHAYPTQDGRAKAHAPDPAPHPPPPNRA